MNFLWTMLSLRYNCNFEPWNLSFSPLTWSANHIWYLPDLKWSFPLEVIFRLVFCWFSPAFSWISSGFPWFSHGFFPHGPLIFPAVSPSFPLDFPSIFGMSPNFLLISPDKSLDLPYLSPHFPWVSLSFPRVFSGKSLRRLSRGAGVRLDRRGRDPVAAAAPLDGALRQLLRRELWRSRRFLGHFLWGFSKSFWGKKWGFF